jgi:hypothetical protein
LPLRSHTIESLSPEESTTVRMVYGSEAYMEELSFVVGGKAVLYRGRYYVPKSARFSVSVLPDLSLEGIGSAQMDRVMLEPNTGG